MSKYKVIFNLSEAEISTKMSRSILVPNCRLITTKKTDLEDDQARSNITSGLVVEVNAVHDAEAFSKALTLCRSVLELLRTRHYIRINLLGAVLVQAVERGDEVWFGLNQPFWKSQGSRGRSVPTFPRKFGSWARLMEKGEGERWLATRWHVSQALRAWPEDIHSAASSVWQGLESLCPLNRGVPNFERVIRFALEKYVTQVVSDFVLYISAQVNRQIGCYRSSGRCDWKNCRPGEDAASWATDALASSFAAPRHGWSAPLVPDILLNRHVGLLASLATGGKLVPPDWLRQRLERDLRHLYGIRNAIVHGGQRNGSERWVNYVAATGLEIIFAVAHDVVNTLKRDSTLTAHPLP